ELLSNDATESIDHRNGHCCHPGPDQPAQRFRHPTELFPYFGTEGIAIVPPEKLISSVTRQCDRYVSPSQLHYQMRGELRRVGKGLVVDRGQPRNEVQRIVRGQSKVGVLGPEVGGHNVRVAAFVICGATEPNGE